MQFDPWNSAIRPDPHRLWNQVRSEHPVVSAPRLVTGNTFAFLTRYEGCVAALHASTLGKGPDKHLPPERIADFGEQGPFDVLERNMPLVDPPDHPRLRTRVPGFSNRAVTALEPRIRRTPSDLIVDPNERRRSAGFFLRGAAEIPAERVA